MLNAKMLYITEAGLIVVNKIDKSGRNIKH